VKLTIEDLARFPRPGAAVPGKLSFSPDGRLVTFLASKSGTLERELVALDARTGERFTLLSVSDVGGGATDANVSREEALRRERERLRETGITHYEWAEEASVLLVPVRGQLWLVPVSDGRRGTPRAVVRDAQDARLSPDGRLVGFVRKGELHVIATDGASAEVRLTHDAQPGVTNGLAEFVAQEEMRRSRGFWFSKDGKRLAFAQVDERHVPVFRIPHLASKDPHDAEEHRYPFTGAENARVRLGVVATSGGPVTWLDTAPYEYVARVAWSPAGEVLVQLQNRAQDVLELRAYDPAAGKHRTILTERSASWVNLHDDLRVLESGDLLWASERTGWKHLYAVSPDGKSVRAVTSGDWAVDAVLGVTKDAVTFTGTKDGPTEKHVYRAPLGGGAVERLTSPGGIHDGVFAKDGSAWVEHREQRTRPPGVYLRATTRSTGREHPIHEPATGIDLPAPELLSFPARDGTTLHAALYRPKTNDALLARPSPVIACVYGGPHVQYVQDSWGVAVDLRAQYLASRGFAVLKVDNRGSARRGLAFESAIHGRMGTIEVDDQVDGVRHLVSLGVADPARVGVYGWSYGGYMTLLCLARAPEVFKVGVSGAPVTEWEGYDTHYTERYMKLPQANPDGYAASSVLTHAGKITGKLLLVHGMIDENVHFRHAARLMDVLAKANRPYDAILFPEERHVPRGEKDRVALEARIVDYFERWL
jgi:dipeptidyl-peptidase-4